MTWIVHINVNLVSASLPVSFFFVRESSWTVAPISLLKDLMILSSAGTFLPSKLMKNSYSSLLRREGRDSMWVKFIPFSYEKEKFWSHGFLGEEIQHKEWINTCVSQQTILYNPNKSTHSPLVATGLEDFHSRERTRKEEWEIRGIHPCPEHHHKEYALVKA